MRKYLAIYCLVLAGCLSPETQSKIDDLNKQVTSLKVALATASPLDAPGIKTRLDKAELDLKDLKSEGFMERVRSGLDKAQQGVRAGSAIAPYLPFLPFAGPILDAIAGLLACAKTLVIKKE